MKKAMSRCQAQFRSCSPLSCAILRRGPANVGAVSAKISVGHCCVLKFVFSTLFFRVFLNKTSF